jgi:purine-nucleoside phosphorylase
MYDRLTDLAAQVRRRSALVPRIAILLGTGLGAVAERIVAEARIPFGELDGMPRATAESHKGEVVLGRLGQVPVVAFSGRLHCYEGHAPAEVVVPVRLAKLLGAEILVMGSAVGGLDPRQRVGDLVVLEDHLNLMGVNPLVGANDERIGPRWPDMIEPYDRRLRALAQEVALARGERLLEGVYAGVLGPNLETRAEYRWLRSCGADVVGMSTVPEAIAAVHCGLRTLAFAIVTDRCLADALEPVDIARIIAAANGAEPRLSALICGVLDRLPG